LIKIEYQR